MTFKFVSHTGNPRELAGLLFNNQGTVFYKIIILFCVHCIYSVREQRSFLYDLRSTLIKFHYTRFYSIQFCDVVYNTLP